MAHDFASRQRKKSQAEQGERRVRGAVPKPQDTSADQEALPNVWSRLPGWGWLGIGLVAGFLIAQMLSPAPEQPLVAAEESEVEGGAVVVEETSPGHQPRFDFYTLLPESEVIAPKIEAYQSTPRDAEDQPKFMLQVGSFRRHEDAERHQQRLKGLDFEGVRIYPVETANGDTWHRVQVGPYQDRRLLARAQDTLAAAGFDFMLLRLRDEPQEEAGQSTAAPEVEAIETREALTE
ncbi:Sporulation related domain-containing protein [Marinospirillum celere]|uniref:Sporulation related domain-containing protein n=1 Tax=Marinospirillum celere TaxID=1122252 RepID=A0A1I1FJE0_9GAMM|nr:SPOR domain-containing protein [Marinospirillum celere]SFB97223.1 Sporulation related domain-containing protein [Marinospirillum celere]